MKNITIITVFVSVVAFVLSGCSKNSPSPDHSLGPVMNNYVSAYIRPVKLFLPDNVSNYQDEENIYTQVMFFTPPSTLPFNDGEAWSREMVDKFEYENIVRPGYMFEQNDDEFPVIPTLVNRYDSLCKAHKDTEYSKKEKHYSGHQFIWATYRRMTLDVTSDTQYDAAHPAGTSLADIVNIKTYSAKEIIENGYDKSLVVKDEQGCLDLQLGHELKMPLEQFNREYRKLIADNIRLNLKTAPDVTSTHRFTVTYRDEDGRVLTATAAPVTLQGKAN